MTYEHDTIQATDPIRSVTYSFLSLVLLLWYLFHTSWSKIFQRKSLRTAYNAYFNHLAQDLREGSNVFSSIVAFVLGINIHQQRSGTEDNGSQNR